MRASWAARVSRPSFASAAGRARRSSGSSSATPRARTSPKSTGRLGGRLAAHRGLVLGLVGLERVGVVELTEQGRIAARAADQGIGRAPRGQAAPGGSEVGRLRVG